MLHKLINIIETPMKATITTITGLVTGYIPITVNNIANVTNNTIDTLFQHAVWTATIIVAITAIVTWTQKQIDRYRLKHPKKLHSIYDDNEVDD